MRAHIRHCTNVSDVTTILLYIFACTAQLSQTSEVWKQCVYMLRFVRATLILTVDGLRPHRLTTVIVVIRGLSIYQQANALHMLR